MMPLVTKETMEGQGKSLSPKTDLSPDLSLVLGTASIVVQIIHVDSDLLMGKIARHVAKRTILPKSAGLEKAKALVVPRNRSNIGKSM